MASRRVYFSDPTGFNDPFDCNPAYIPFQLREKIPIPWGVLCFFEDVTSPVMWAHYGRTHTGCCIEVDAWQMITKANVLRPVNYTTSRMVFMERGLPLREQIQEDPAASMEEKDIFVQLEGSVALDRLEQREKVRLESRLQDAALAKSSGWSYEQEWRLLSEAKNNLSTIPNDCITAVYFGTELARNETACENLEAEINKTTRGKVEVRKLEANPLMYLLSTVPEPPPPSKRFTNPTR